uniref:LIM zinc-binding domain-containing protein n=1 Tax=Hucho hucho TaxID=62062 RepID=A0A4W5QNX4_9TELE
QNFHFHVKCFTCQVCGCDLARSGFFQKGGEYICTEDYQRLYGTKCDSCGDFITGEVVSALGRTYHPKCFVCNLDGPSTSKSIPLQSTGLGVTLIPSTINANPTITPGETKLQLVSEEHFLPVLSGPATVGLCP